MNVDEVIAEALRQIPQPLWGNWRIKEKIGSGSFGAVYRVEAARMNRTDVSAVKIEPILPDERFAADEERSRSFLERKRAEIEEESAIMYKLKGCPNVVAYEDEDVKEFYRVGKLAGYVFLIRMELLRNVYDLMNSRGLNMDEGNIVRMAREIGRGLKAAHDAGVIHRDVKPSNFFVSKEGVYKLGDFNIAKQTSYTRSFAGTEGYIAPEIYRAKSGNTVGYTAKADIYSLGISLYQFMNGGLFPFEDNCDTDSAVDRRMSGESLPPPRFASPDFARAILKACAFAPEDRYRDMAEMLADLEALPAGNVPAYSEGAGFAAPRQVSGTAYADPLRPSDGLDTVSAEKAVYATEIPAAPVKQGISKAAKTALIALTGALVLLTGVVLYIAFSSAGRSSDTSSSETAPAVVSAETVPASTEAPPETTSATTSAPATTSATTTVTTTVTKTAAITTTEETTTAPVVETALTQTTAPQPPKTTIAVATTVAETTSEKTTTAKPNVCNVEDIDVDGDGVVDEHRVYYDDGNVEAFDKNGNWMYTTSYMMN